MLERGDAAKFGKAVFFQDRNDIDVYIEDTTEGYPKLYAKLLSRALGGNIALEKVFPLGGRANVISAARRELGPEKSSRCSIFLVDGDLYLLTGEREPIPENIIVIPRYCIENFLIDENAFLSILDEERPDKGFDALKEEFQFNEWHDTTSVHLNSLFKVFAIAHKLGVGIPTVSRGSKAVCLDGYGNVCPQKSSQLLVELKKAIIDQYGEDSYNEFHTDIESKISLDLDFLLTYVSAKDFLLPLILIRFRRLTTSKLTNTGIKMRLSNICSIDPLRTVAERINTTYQNHMTT